MTAPTPLSACRRGGGHSKAPMTGKIFSGVRQKWLPLYTELRDAARQALGEFAERESSRGVVWERGAAFAEFSARKDCMIIAFMSSVPRPEWKAAKMLQTSAHRVVHYFEATDSKRFSWFIKRIAESEQLICAKPPRKRAGAEPNAAASPSSIDEYIAVFPDAVRKKLEQVRRAVHSTIPKAEEKISWKMPTFYQDGIIMQFAAFKNHLSIFPGPQAVAAFQNELGAYTTSKGAVQFPFDQPLPLDLIKRITRFRLEEQQKHNAQKAQKKR
jgi:uncharacterized protein YdhG (YjbR/CyaY superfamily)